MSDERKTLPIPSGLEAFEDFAPRAAKAEQPRDHAETRKAVDAVSHFPSREARGELQLNMKGPRDLIERFKALCKADRRSYHAMLEILMDHFEQDTQGHD